jgi:tRNA(fMet)-specific endonuclease VapC
VLSRVRSVPPGDLALTSMTEAELHYGVLNSSDPERNLARVETFLSGPIDSLPFDSEAARVHAQLRYALRGRPIGERDLVIASTTLAHGGVLVTSNTREFSRVPNLVLEDWIESA